MLLIYCPISLFIPPVKLCHKNDDKSIDFKRHIRYYITIYEVIRHV